jgi:hypothetical protein
MPPNPLSALQICLHGAAADGTTHDALFDLVIRDSYRPAEHPIRQAPYAASDPGKHACMEIVRAT